MIRSSTARARTDDTLRAGLDDSGNQPRVQSLLSIERQRRRLHGRGRSDVAAVASALSMCDCL